MNSADRLQDTLADGPITPSPTAGAVSVPGLAGKCPLLPGDLPKLRYLVSGELGTGTTGVVLAATDTSLRRDIAIKFIGHGELTAARGERLLHEARVAASLEHPAIVPLYDIDCSPAGDLYLTMKRARGRSLGQALTETVSGTVAAEIATTYARIDIVLSVCDGVAAAHARAVIHRDIKPDNIVVGSFGEVVLVDWGLASETGSIGADGLVVGTPLYMSPEQARGGSPTRGDDIYALGATLFHLLYLRPPLAARADINAFWRCKRAGEIDLPSAEERRRVPARLAAIVSRAIHPDPTRRYHAVVDLAADLRAYVAGLSVTAYRDPWLVRGLGWLRRHGRAIAIGATIVTLLIAISGMAWRDRLQQIARWGSPSLVETPTADWEDRWVGCTGSFIEQDGALVSQGSYDSLLFLRRQLVGEVAIEYTGRMLGSSPCDLSLVYTTELRIDGQRASYKPFTWQFKFGAFDATTTQILGPTGEVLSSALIVPEPDRDYHVRVEICEDRLSLLIDGALVCSAAPPILPSAGYIGLFAYYPGKSFRDIRVFAKGLPARPRATVVGDVLFTQGRLEDALVQFERVIDTHAGSDLGAEAAYKRALCLRGLGRNDEASVVWPSLVGTAWEVAAHLMQIQDLNDRGRKREALDDVRKLAQHRDPTVRTSAALAWASLMHRHIQGGNLDLGLIDAFLAVQQADFPNDPTARATAAVALHNLSRVDELLARFPDSHQSAWLMFRIGRHEEALARFPKFAAYVATVLIDSGRAPEAFARFRDNPVQAARALNEMGRPEEALALCPTGANADAARLMLGRLDEAIANASSPDARERALIWGGQASVVADDQSAWLRADAVIALGEPERVLSATFVDWREATFQARQILALRRFIAGEGDAALAAFSAAADAANNPTFQDYWYGCPHHLLRPFLGRLGGDHQSWSTALDFARSNLRHRFRGSVWHAASFIAGDIDEQAFLTQPNARYAAAELLLWRGMKAEVAGDPAAAVVAYRAWLCVPPWRRSSEIDQLWPTFAQWRVDALGR